MHRMSPIFFKRTQFHRKNNIHDRTECFMIISKVRESTANSTCNVLAGFICRHVQ